jgi:hypothetical protein
MFQGKLVKFSPLHHAEQRRHKGGFSKRLFEPSEFIGEFPIAAFMLSSAREPLGRGVGVPLYLVTFGAKHWYFLRS